MAFVHGKSTSVLLDQYDLSGYLNSSDITRTTESHETTTYGTTGGAKTYITGLRDGTLSLGGLWDGSAGAIDVVLEATLSAASGQVVTLAPAGMAVGSRVNMLSSRSTSYAVSDPVGDLVTVSVDLQADGGIDGGVSLHALTAETGAANSASVNNGAATTNGYSAHLHVTAVTATSAVVKVQHSANDSTWADLVTFTAATTGGGATSQRVTGTGTVNQYTRMDLSGTITSVTFGLGFARR